MTLATIVSRADVTDPVGYAMLEVSAGETGLLPLLLVPDSILRAEVISVSGNEVTCDQNISPRVVGGGRIALRVRHGDFNGLASAVVDASGPVVTLDDAVDGYVQVGDTVEFHTQWALGDLLEPATVGVMRASNGQDGDLVTIWQGESQQGRSFYLTVSDEWIEVGNEAAGDRSDAVIPFTAGLIYRRRAETKLEFINVGLVPWPSFSRYAYVYPGRNVITSPATSGLRLDVWHAGLSNTFLPGDSAARADTIQLSYVDGSKSPVLYLDPSLTWRAVGSEGDAGATAVNLVMAVDLQRKGEAGFIGLKGLSEDFGPSSREAPVVEVSDFEVLPEADALVVSWKGAEGKNYRVQVRPLGQREWLDQAGVVEGRGPTCSVRCLSLEGSGTVRVIELP